MIFSPLPYENILIGYILYELYSEIGSVVDTFLLKKGEKSLKIPKGYSEVVNRRMTDNRMVIKDK
jgi:hypothetical protein